MAHEAEKEAKEALLAQAKEELEGKHGKLESLNVALSRMTSEKHDLVMQLKQVGSA